MAERVSVCWLQKRCLSRQELCCLRLTQRVSVDPNRIVRAIDAFIVLANLNLIAAHLIGAVISFWLIDRIHHYRHLYHYEYLPD